MASQWERADPAEHDYDERWDYAGDGYLKVFVSRREQVVCDKCGRFYHHFFASHGDWRAIPLEFRSMRLCVDCYAQVHP